jgi:hypothetical protein
LDDAQKAVDQGTFSGLKKLALQQANKSTI